MPQKKSRTLTLSDATFDTLNQIALYRRLAGERASVSGIVEELVRAYVEHDDSEIKKIKEIRAEMKGDDKPTAE